MRKGEGKGGEVEAANETLSMHVFSCNAPNQTVFRS